MSDKDSFDRIRELIEEHGGERKEELISALEDMSSKAVTDRLTGIYNRGFMDETLARELAGSCREHEPLSLALLDIDNFKSVNDSLGHNAGDEILVGLARFLLGKSRKTDIIGRYGGEEFEVIMPHTCLKNAYRAMESMRKRVEREEIGNERRTSITISGGVSSSDVVGVPLLYGISGRELIERFADRQGNVTSEDVRKAIEEYSHLSKTDPEEVELMLRNVYGFLEDNQGKYDSLGKNFEEIAMDLIAKRADEALYRSKEMGRNRVYANTGNGIMTL